jgi:hypothetical protein
MKGIDNSTRMKIVSLAVAQGAMVSVLGSLLLTIGFILQLGEFFWYFWAMFLVMALLPTGRLIIALESVICTCLLFFCLTGFNFVYVIPYVLMSLYVIVRYALDRSARPRFLTTALKLIFFDGALFAIYYLTVLFVFPEGFSERLVALLILTAGSGVGLLWDFVMGKLQRKVNVLTSVFRIAPFGAGAQPRATVRKHGGRTD